MQNVYDRALAAFNDLEKRVLSCLRDKEPPVAERLPPLRAALARCWSFRADAIDAILYCPQRAGRMAADINRTRVA